MDAVEHMEEDEYIQHIEEVQACNIECRDDDCRVTCSIVVFEEWDVPLGYSKTVEDQKIEEKKEFKKTSIKDLVSEALSFNEKYNVPITIDTEYGRAIVEDGEVIGAVAPNREACSVLLEKLGVDPNDVEAVDLSRGAMCFPRHILREYQTRSLGFPDYIAKHPLIKVFFARDYKYVNTADVWLMAWREGSLAGFFDDSRLIVAVNPVWIATEVLKFAVGFNESKEKVVDDVFRTIVHEEGHYADFINNVEFKGHWMGEHPLETVVSFITGKPIPAGREKAVEKLASEIVHILPEIDPNVKDVVSRYIDEELSVLKECDDDMEQIENLKKAMKENDLFFGGSWHSDASKGVLILSLHQD